MPDVEAQPDRDAGVVAVGHELPDHRHRRRLARRRQVLDEEVVESRPSVPVAPSPSSVRWSPDQRSARRSRIGPVRDAERADVPAGRVPARGGGPVDRPVEPGGRRSATRGIRMEQQVVRVGREPGERRVELETGGRGSAPPAAWAAAVDDPVGTRSNECWTSRSPSRSRTIGAQSSTSGQRLTAKHVSIPSRTRIVSLLRSAGPASGRRPTR